MASPQSSMGSCTPRGAWANGPPSPGFTTPRGGAASVFDSNTPEFGNANANAASSNSPFLDVNSTFARAIDTTILKLSATAAFSREEAGNAARKVLGEAGVPCTTKYEIEGPATGVTHIVRFTGSVADSARLVRKVLDDQKVDKNEWKRFKVKSTEKDAQGQLKEENLYINPDKNAKQVRTEIGMRKVSKIIRGLYAEKQFQSVDKLGGVVAVSWKPLLRVVAENPTSLSVQWNPAMVEKFGIDRKAVDDEFNADLGAGANINWV